VYGGARRRYGGAGRNSRETNAKKASTGEINMSIYIHILVGTHYVQTEKNKIGAKIHSILIYIIPTIHVQARLLPNAKVQRRVQKT